MLEELLQRVFFFCACIQMRLCCDILSIVATHCLGYSALRGTGSNILFHSRIQRQKHSRRNHSWNTCRLAFDTCRAVAWLCACPPNTSVRTTREQPGGRLSWQFAPLTSPLPTWDLATASPNTLPKSARGDKNYTTVANFMWRHSSLKLLFPSAGTLWKTIKWWQLLGPKPCWFFFCLFCLICSFILLHVPNDSDRGIPAFHFSAVQDVSR